MTHPPFQQIVEEHGAVVMRVCRALLAGSDADEAWSDTFVAALRHYPDLPSGSNVKGWLVTIAHNKSIDVLRAAARRPVPVGDVPDRAAAGTCTPDAALDRDDELRSAVQNLPAKQRAAVVYRYLADLSYAEVGDLIGSTQAAARRSAADGIARLRQTYRKAST